MSQFKQNKRDLMATYLAERDELKCPLCERNLTSNEYQEHIKKELQRTRKVLADYEEELYEKDQQIQWLEDRIRLLLDINKLIPPVNHLSESQKTFDECKHNGVI